MKKILDLSSRSVAIGSMLIVAFAFVGCGDEDSSFAPRDNTVSDSDIVAESFDDLLVCSIKREGAAAYVKDEKTAYICTGGSWVPEEETSSSSSETTQSSSSITTATPCNVDDVNNCVTDSRDGRTYRTVKIGDQVWMAENLNYAYTGVPFDNGYYTSDSTSWCYDNVPANCAMYGRLYTWAAAMDSVGEWSTNGKGCGSDQTCSPIYPVRGVCPEGWHLPDTTEWNALFTLFTAVGDRLIADMVLNSTSGLYPSGWYDAFGCSAHPAGRRYGLGYFGGEGYLTYLWSSTENGSYYAYYMGSDCSDGSADLDNDGKLNGFSVRCLKD